MTADLFVIDAPDEPAETVSPDARVVGDVIRLRAARTPHRQAFFSKHDGRWTSLDWHGVYERSRQIAQGLVELGLEVGDCVCVLGPTHAEWCFEELGAQLCGLVTNGIYPMQSAEQVRYLLEHSETRAIFVADEHELETVLEAVSSPLDPPEGTVRGDEVLRAIVPWSDDLAERYAEVDERVISPSRFRGEMLAEEEIDARLAAVDPESTAILIYTSGTTGPPKGAMISHANMIQLLNLGGQLIPLRQNDVLLSFLPMAHATERNLGFYSRLSQGVAMAFASSIGAVLSELSEVRPTVFGSVPRIFEKAYDRIQSDVAKKSGLARRLFAWADGVARRRIRLVLAGERVPATLEQQYRLADRLIFKKIRAAFGGRARLCITGAAPISYEILEFFWAVGLPIYEAYGMTEATVVTHMNLPEAFKLGTVGRVIPSLECRVADDGEVLIRGPLVFKGYLKNDEATRETVVDGWLHTGDVGEIDDEGYLRITDRKKHLIITAGGKNVAPANIERAIKQQSPLISQVHAHGDRRAYVSALIAPSPIETLEWGAQNGLVTAEELAARTRELLANPAARSPELNAAMARVTADARFQQLFLEPVGRGNRDLARVERVRRFRVLDRDFSQEEGELTPTMKTKRKFIETKYAELFDRIYHEDGFATDAPVE